MFPWYIFTKSYYWLMWKYNSMSLFYAHSEYNNNFFLLEMNFGPPPQYIPIQGIHLHIRGMGLHEVYVKCKPASISFSDRIYFLLG